MLFNNELIGPFVIYPDLLYSRRNTELCAVIAHKKLPPHTLCTSGGGLGGQPIYKNHCFLEKQICKCNPGAISLLVYFCILLPKKLLAFLVIYPFVCQSSFQVPESGPGSEAMQKLHSRSVVLATLALGYFSQILGVVLSNSESSG